MKDKPITQERLHFLANTLSEIKDPQIMDNLLQDLCTLPELESIADRLWVAQYLSLGHSYRQIQTITGVSLATITRVAKHLNHGHGGYLAIFPQATK